MSAVPVVLTRPQSWPDAAPRAEDARRVASEIGAAIAAAKARGPRIAVVVVTNNRRTMLTVRPNAGRFELRVAWPLLAHADAVVAAVTAWRRTGRLPAEFHDVVRGLGAAERDAPRRPPKLRSAGDHVDLRAVLDDVARIVDAADVAAGLTIGWARRSRGRRTVRLGSAQPELGVIRINPALDRASVPEYVVRMVVYHELCHVIAPPLTARAAREQGEGRRVHHRRFRQLESRFPELDEANRWVRDNLDQLLAR